jgi:transcriptional regulator with XRE-family HTH domain
MVTKSSPPSTEADIPGVRQRAAWILHHPAYLAFLRKLKRESRADLAARCGLDEEIIEQIESGSLAVIVGDLFAVARSFYVPPEDADEDYVYYDPNDKMKGGKRKKRDKWGGKRPEEYKDWYHREIKPHLHGDNPDIGKEGHDEYERQWRELGCPRPDEIATY